MTNNTMETIHPNLLNRCRWSTNNTIVKRKRTSNDLRYITQQTKFDLYFPTSKKKHIALFFTAFIHEILLLLHIEAPYSISEITRESAGLVNIEYSKPPLALHLTISKSNDLLPDFATAFAISLYFKYSMNNNPRCI